MKNYKFTFLFLTLNLTLLFSCSPSNEFQDKDLITSAVGDVDSMAVFEYVLNDSSEIDQKILISKTYIKFNEDGIVDLQRRYDANDKFISSIRYSKADTYKGRYTFRYFSVENSYIIQPFKKRGIGEFWRIVYSEKDGVAFIDPNKFLVDTAFIHRTENCIEKHIISNERIEYLDRLCFDEAGNKIGENIDKGDTREYSIYRYDSDNLLLTKSVTIEGTSDGKIVSEEDFTYQYEIDVKKNWVERTEYNRKGKAIMLLKREIFYR